MCIYIYAHIQICATPPQRSTFFEVFAGFYGVLKHVGGGGVPNIYIHISTWLVGGIDVDSISIPLPPLGLAGLIR